MSFLVARLLAAAIAVGTAAPVLTGALTGALADPAFVAPDMMLAALLLLGAGLPERWAGPVLASGSAYALGVFSVAVFSRLASGGAPSPALWAAGVGSAVILGILGRRFWLNRASR